MRFLDLTTKETFTLYLRRLPSPHDRLPVISLLVALLQRLSQAKLFSVLTVRTVEHPPFTPDRPTIISEVQLGKLSVPQG